MIKIKEVKEQKAIKRKILLSQKKIQIRKTHRHLIKKMIRIPQIQEVDQIL